MTDTETLQEMAEYFSGCYMNAAHGQSQQKFQRYIDTLHRAKKLIGKQEPRLMDGNYCPSCSFSLGWSTDELGGTDNVRYCPHCGQAVKWE